MFRKKGKPAKKINNCSEKDITHVKVVRDKTNPTQKPLNIIRKYIVNSSEPGEVVLDPFIGSGTVAEAAILEDRDFIGFDLDKEQVDLANNRASKACLVRLAELGQENGEYGGLR
jgi:site-specific DNA-methyltransferase (adenine-specific)